MKKDLAIDEIRQVRHRISERFGHDTKSLLDHYRRLQEKYRDRLLAEGAEAPPDPAASKLIVEKGDGKGE